MLRLPTIKQGLRDQKSYQEIAELCHIKSEKTIDRDMALWLNSGLFEEWIKTEFLQLHHAIRLHCPIEAYKEIAKLTGKLLVQKREVKTEIHEEIHNIIDIGSYSDAEKTILDNAAIIFATKEDSRLHNKSGQT